MSRAFVDTSAYFAYINPNDIAHGAAQRIMTRLADTHASLLTSNFVIAETHALLLTRMSHVAAAGFLDAIFTSATRIIRVHEADETAARELIRHHADKEYSYTDATDATSFAIMKRLHIHEAFSLDHHFAQYGFTLVQ